MKRIALLLCSLVPLAALAMSLGCSRGTGASLEGRPVAAVIGDTRHDRAYLSLIDLRTFKIARVLKLRSLTLDIAADPQGRRLGTAQCGGLGSDVDDAMGVVDIDTAESVRYVTLPFPNPYDIEFTDGRFSLLHGFQQQHALRFSVVGARSAEVVATGGLNEMATTPKAVGRAIYTPVMRARGVEGRVAVTRVLRDTEVTTLGVYPGNAAVIAQDVNENADALILFLRHSGRDAVKKVWSAAVVDTATGRVLVRKPVSVDTFVSNACVFGDYVAFTDSNSGMGYPGSGVRVLNRRSLEEEYDFSIMGEPTSVAAWNESLLVVDGSNQELLLYRPGETTPVRRVKFGKTGANAGAIAVFP